MTTLAMGTIFKRRSKSLFVEIRVKSWLRERVTRQ
jgi:hypothetical protein